MKATFRALIAFVSIVSIGAVTLAAQEKISGQGRISAQPSAEKVAIGEIAADRQAVVSRIVNRPFLPSEGPLSDPRELETILRTLSDDRLAAALLSETAAELKSALIPSSRDGRTPRQLSSDPLPESPATRFLGSPTTDLVFNRVTPCRIFDTRHDSRGLMTADETRNFAVQGTRISDQGGDTNDCPEVPFDPPIIAFTITVANPQGNGNVQVWESGIAAPGVSLINFVRAENIANTTYTSVCIGCGAWNDINVRVAINQAQVVGTIVGYYSPPQGCFAGEVEVGGLCLETALRPATDFFTASETCESLGGRLPTVGELFLALNFVTGNDTAGEHTDDIYVFNSSFRNTRVVDPGGLADAFTLTDGQYRCAFDLFGF